jgi:hypothetical protein
LAVECYAETLGHGVVNTSGKEEIVESGHRKPTFGDFGKFGMKMDNKSGATPPK